MVLRALEVSEDFDGLYKRGILTYGRTKSGRRVLLTDYAEVLANKFEEEVKATDNTILKDLGQLIRTARDTSFPRYFFRSNQSSFLIRRPRVLVYQSTLEADRSLPILRHVERSGRGYYKTYVLYNGNGTEKNASAIGEELKNRGACTDYELIRCDSYNSMHIADTLGKVLKENPNGYGYDVDVAFDGSTRVAIPSTLAAIKEHAFETQKSNPGQYHSEWLWASPESYDVRNRGHFSGNMKLWPRRPAKFHRGLIISEFQLSRMEAYATLDVEEWDIVVPTTLAQEHANRISWNNATRIQQRLGSSVRYVIGVDYSGPSQLESILRQRGPYDLLCLGGGKVLCLAISTYWGTNLSNHSSCTLAYAKLDWDSKDFSSGYGMCSVMSLTIEPEGTIRFD